jgi:hypothetical protein
LVKNFQILKEIYVSKSKNITKGLVDIFQALVGDGLLSSEVKNGNSTEV